MNPRRGSRRHALAVVALLAALAPADAALADPAPAASDAPAAEAAPATPPPATPAAPPSAQIPAPVAPPAAARSSGPVTGGSTSGMISGLVFLLVLVLGAAWLVKRSGGMPALRGGSAIKIVAAQSLGPRERVVLIEAGGQQWLLGVGGGTVSLLHHFEQPIAAAGTDDFAGKLRQFLPQAVGK